jgi:hypothetical protein
MADRPDRPTLRFAKVLREQKQVVGSYLALEQKIHEANGREKDRRVDRRKLRRLADDEDVSLTLDELRALDVFLTPLGEGLADRPLFDKPNPIRSLVEKGVVTIVLGAYPRQKQQRNDMSRWDVLSMAHLVRKIELQKPGTQLEIKDLLPDENLSRPPYLKHPGKSVCSIGSPRTCLATEQMLAKMFRVKAFTPEEFDRVPVHFLWSPTAKLPYGSAFSHGSGNPRDVRSEPAPKTRGRLVRPVLEVDGKRYEDSTPRPGTRGHATGRSYGVVVAQQRAEGDVWIVAAGLTGPATFACASAVAAGLTGTVPEARDGHSQIRWDVVEATVQRRSGVQGDAREVSGVAVLDGAAVAPNAGRPK